VTTPLSQTLQALLARLPQTEQLEVMSLFEAVYTVRFTGPITFDFLNGVPRQINLGAPIRLTICHADPPGAPQAGLDSTAKSQAG
jgi:hypothetical protein